MFRVFLVQQLVIIRNKTENAFSPMLPEKRYVVLSKAIHITKCYVVIEKAKAFLRFGEKGNKPTQNVLQKVVCIDAVGDGFQLKINTFLYA